MKKYDHIRIRPKGILLVIIIVTSVFFVHISLVKSTYGLTRYFNCITRAANNNDAVTLKNVESCYYKVFQGARDADADGHKLK